MNTERAYASLVCIAASPDRHRTFHRFFPPIVIFKAIPVFTFIAPTTHRYRLATGGPCKRDLSYRELRANFVVLQSPCVNMLLCFPALTGASLQLKWFGTQASPRLRSALPLNTRGTGARNRTACEPGKFARSPFVILAHLCTTVFTLSFVSVP